MAWASDCSELSRSTCALSHDIHTPINIQVLKNRGLFGLNEAQLRILLLQNDPCLFPEVSPLEAEILPTTVVTLSLTDLSIPPMFVLLVEIGSYIAQDGSEPCFYLTLLFC